MNYAPSHMFCPFFSVTDMVVFVSMMMLPAILESVSMVTGLPRNNVFVPLRPVRRVAVAALCERLRDCLVGATIGIVTEDTPHNLYLSFVYDCRATVPLKTPR